MTRVQVFIIVAVVLVSLLLQGAMMQYHTDREEAEYLNRNKTVQQKFFSHGLETSNTSFDHKTDSYQWGRTTHPSFSADLHPLNPVQRYLVQKEFVWMSVTAGDWLFGFAILQFNYQSTVVLQLYNIRTGESVKRQSDVLLLSPFTKWGGKWHPNENGETGPMASGHSITFESFPLSSTKISVNITFRDQSVHFRVSASDKSGFSLEADAAASIKEGMTGMVYPLGPKRPAVVYKTSAVRLQSPLHLRWRSSEGVGKEIHTIRGRLSMDYTRGLLRRHTEWKWASVATTRVGLHLSSGTYDTTSFGLENAVFRPSKPAYFLNETVQFTNLTKTSGKGFESEWEINSTSVYLRFTSVDGYGGKVNMGVVNVSLDHRWGVYNGHVNIEGEKIEFFNVPGVFEDHFALW